MNKPLLKTLLGAGCVSLAVVGTASAGGFSRGTADTDILFEEGNFNMRMGVTIVAPQRKYETVTAPPAMALVGVTGTVAGTDDVYSDTYAIPSSAIKFNLTDDLRCAGTHTISNGSGATYGPQAIAFGGWADGTGTVSEGFTSNEFGATCGYKFDLEKGRAWIIGGAFLEDFKYSQTVQFNGTVLALGGVPALAAAALNGTNATLRFNGNYEPGFRIGAAYEIPEIALRAQIMYRSEINHNPDGSLTTALDPLAGGAGSAKGEGTLPQSLEFKVQSGVAPGWLAFGSVKWTDWSVVDTLDYTITGGPLPGIRELEYYLRDGWTVSGGIGHSFNETVSGALSFTWDRGVGTTEVIYTDTYTLGAGLSLRDVLGGELRFGGAVSYLTSGSVDAESQPTSVGSPDPGNSFAYTVGDDWSYAATASYKVKW